jgi:hypothetical protein
MDTASNSKATLILLASIMKKHPIGEDTPQQKLKHLVNAAVHQQTN